MNKSIYSFTARTMKGEEFSFEKYKGKALMILNIATECGHTPQLKKLEAIYQKYKNDGLEIIAFPSNQFAQEPREGESISDFCSINYGVTFTICEKTNVRGQNTHPLFQFFSTKELNGKFSAKPRWNFYKYIFDRNGNAVDYFISYTQPDANRVTRAIKKALAQ